MFQKDRERHLPHLFDLIQFENTRVKQVTVFAFAVFYTISFEKNSCTVI
jgi:hypothetical protein